MCTLPFSGTADVYLLMATYTRVRSPSPPRTRSRRASSLSLLLRGLLSRFLLALFCRLALSICLSACAGCFLLLSALRLGLFA
jgi:hypothetical protein